MYARTLGIARWKDRPGRGAVRRGISKRQVTAAEQGGLERFVVRPAGPNSAGPPGPAWCSGCGTAGVVPIMVAPGLAVNLPFAVQRYNRIRAAGAPAQDARRAGRVDPTAAQARRQRRLATTGNSIRRARRRSGGGRWASGQSR
jgi:hypothetical protein